MCAKYLNKLLISNNRNDGYLRSKHRQYIKLKTESPSKMPTNNTNNTNNTKPSEMNSTVQSFKFNRGAANASPTGLSEIDNNSPNMT